MGRRSVTLTDEQFQAISKAIADPRRFAIFEQVASSIPFVTCSALREYQNISPATMSHHIKELSEAGLVDGEREGRVMNLTIRREVWAAYLKRLGAL